MVKTKGKVNKKISVTRNNEARQTALQVRELKKSFKTELAKLNIEFKDRLKAITVAAYQKAITDIERDNIKRTQAKSKLLHETATKFDKSFKSKLPVMNIAKSAKKSTKATRPAMKKRGRPAKKA